MCTDILVGEAELTLLNDNRLTEGRHILPLTGSLDSYTTYGSLTVEVKLNYRLIVVSRYLREIQ